MPVLDISIARPTEATDGEFVAEVTKLINRVYADAEQGLWRDGTNRTDQAEVATLLRAGQLAVARIDGRLVGSVWIQRLDSGEGEFGMLVADPAHRGVGIGRELVAFAERWARDQELPRMQLELLVPRTWRHPVKEFLHDWYTRMGYREVRKGAFEEEYAALWPHLATPCDFRIYHKSL